MERFMKFSQVIVGMYLEIWNIVVISLKILS